LELVLDTSVAVKWYAPEDHSIESLELVHMARRGSVRLVSPDILLPEFCHTLQKAVRAGVLPGEGARDVLLAFRRVPIDPVPATELADEALELGE
jgi:predicted nucleic acid-binding protein